MCEASSLKEEPLPMCVRLSQPRASEQGKRWLVAHLPEGLWQLGSIYNRRRHSPGLRWDDLSDFG
jgi:hypothetical protein